MSKKKSKPNQTEVWASYEDELPFEKQSFTPLSLDEIEEEASLEGRLNDETVPLGQILIGEYEELLVIDDAHDSEILIEDNPALMIDIGHMAEDELPFEKQTFMPISLDDLTELISDVDTKGDSSAENLATLRTQILAKISQANEESKIETDNKEKDNAHEQAGQQRNQPSQKKQSNGKQTTGRANEKPRAKSTNKSNDTNITGKQSLFRGQINQRICISRSCARYHQARRQKFIRRGSGLITYRLGMCRSAVR